MSRSLDAGNTAAIAEEVVRPVHLVELDMVAGYTRVTDADRSLWFDADGDTVDEEFLGVGDLGSVSAIEETTEGKLTRVTLKLTGVKASMVAIALGSGYRRRPARIWRGYLDSDYAWAGTPILRYAGLMDTMPITLRDGMAEIELTIVNRFAHWERPINNPRYDDSDHQKRRPGDTFFERLPEVAAGKEVFWGRA